jgi:hypothetical protein
MELLFSVGVNVNHSFFEFVFLFFGDLSLFELVFNPFDDDLIGSVSLSGLEVLNQDVGKLGDMTRVLKDDTGGDAGTVDFEHILFQDKKLSPQGLNIAFDGRSNGTKVIQSCTSSIDFKTLEKNVSSLDQIV